ncbi:uracil-DNA glycosylase [Polynucleobacter sp. IMCC30063]|uniref:uracil-DNA glycosylase n=1 Tax=Polynucleobacter sp. IMCC30063 TaxID=2907298 RepID=UPI001F1ADD5C|nr:uracil-DNA glycosylase [Polynucleobacter sp. IMCC30063]MCE7505018.1 uracil-DNA glycosylase [Polynucleobacter sp. IMCC30063]
MRNLTDAIPLSWRELLRDYLQSAAWHELQSRLQAEIRLYPQAICPPPEFFFKALELTAVDQVKVVILGQDPYHSPGLAQGLAFSIPADIAIHSKQFPSSLRNISKALALEGLGLLKHGDLSHWAKQGVLLLNTALSVRLGKPTSHTHLGWGSLIDHLILQLARQRPNLVWLLWGGHAQAKLPLIERSETGIQPLILQASHPSGLGVYKTKKPFLEAGNTGSCRHFIQSNQWLQKLGKAEISWASG